MLPGDRRIAGVWCSEVLEKLSEYLDGQLPSDTSALLAGHVAECTRCAEFGAEFGAAIAALRTLEHPDPVAPAVASRLRARLFPPVRP
jgi:anti-sigma factor RsiW